MASSTSMDTHRPDKYGFIRDGSSSEGEGRSQHHTIDSSSRSADEQKKIDLWEDMVYNWKNWVEHRRDKVRARCCEGIPHELRGRVWFKISGAYDLMKSNEGVYEKLISQPDGDSHSIKCIALDVNRFFRNHVMFFEQDGQGQQKLKSVLKAYTLYDKSSGEYTGALGSIAAFLLMHMSAKNAFWCLVQITEHYLPGYYEQGWDEVIIDMKVFNKVLARVTPHVGRFISVNDIDSSLISMIWFQTIFTSRSQLPWESILRIFDLFLFEGRETLFRVSMAVFNLTLKDMIKNSGDKTLDDPIQIFMAFAPSSDVTASLQPETLIPEAMKLPVRMKDVDKIRSEMVKEHYKELERQRKEKKSKVKPI